MKLPTGAIDESLNLVHKASGILLMWCGIVLMVLAVVFGGSAYQRTFGKGGTADKIEQTMEHLNQSADATHTLIAEESGRQKELYDKLGKTVEAAGGTIRQANTTIEKLGKAIEVVQTDFTSTTGAVNGTLGGVQTTLAAVRTDAETANAAIEGIRPVLDQGRETLKSAQALTEDPSIGASLRHIDEASGHVAEMASSGEHIARTIDSKVSQLAHPTRTQRVISGILTTLRGASYLGWLVK